MLHSHAPEGSAASDKLMWGHRHIDDLERRLDAYLATHPYVIVQEPVPDGVLLRLQVRAHPPKELALLAGDALHNLRSALDVRLVSLAEHLVGPLSDEQEKCLQLPDAATPDKLRKQQAQWGRQFATSVAEDLRRIVEPLLGHDTTEPSYWMRRHGNTTAGEEADTHLALAARLRRLRRLSNVDKHRRLQLLCWAVDFFSASVTTPEQITWTIRPGPWSDGDEVARLVGTREADDWLHSISAKLTVVLPDADLGTGASAASELENIAWFVEQALQIIEFGQGELASMRRF